MQWKDAALTTLQIQKLALDYGMTLKDANFFNIQFFKGKPVLIDTSSFEEYEEGVPWIAYKQFCENFLAPLYLMSNVNVKLRNLVLGNINGIELGLASKLLPMKTWFNRSILFHIHLHSIMQSKYSGNKIKETPKCNLSKKSLLNLVIDIYDAIERIKPPFLITEWSDYYKIHNYSEESFDAKLKLVSEFSSQLNPQKILDLGANNGTFSRLLYKEGVEIFSTDVDESAVEQNYLMMKKNKEENLHPLIFDIANPSLAVGFKNAERTNLKARIGNIDLVLALAITHHMRITYNIPFDMQAEYFSNLGKFLIIEYIDKQDSKIQQMLLNRKDIFDDYSKENFETIFSAYYKILKSEKITHSHRILYLMERKS